MKKSTLIRWWPLLSVISVAMPSRVSYAETPPEEAKRLVRQGSELYSKGDHAGALKKFEEAYQLFPSYKIDFNIAATLRDLGRPARAAMHFERFLNRADKLTARDRLQSARAALRELQARLASVALRGAPSRARVRVDGNLVGSVPLATRIYLEPGTHGILVEKVGHPPFARDLAVAAGERLELDAALGPEKLRGSTAGAGRIDKERAAAADMEPGRRGGQQADSLPARRRTKTIWAYTTLGIGLALVAGAGTLYGVGAVQGSSAHDRYSEATAHPGAASEEDVRGYQSDVETARAELVAGHVLLGAGAALVALSIYEFVTRPAASPEAGTRTLGPGLVPFASGAALSWGGRF